MGGANVIGTTQHVHMYSIFMSTTFGSRLHLGEKNICVLLIASWLPGNRRVVWLISTRNHQTVIIIRCTHEATKPCFLFKDSDEIFPFDSRLSYAKFKSSAENPVHTGMLKIRDVLEVYHAFCFPKSSSPAAGALLFLFDSLFGHRDLPVLCFWCQ